MRYERQNFKSGEKLYASQLNSMDEQIAKNAEDVAILKENGGGGGGDEKYIIDISSSNGVDWNLNGGNHAEAYSAYRNGQSVYIRMAGELYPVVTANDLYVLAVGYEVAFQDNTIIRANTIFLSLKSNNTISYKSRS